MSPRTKTIISASLAAALAIAIGASTRATAGRKDLWTITVDTVGKQAYGSLGSVRNSADPTQSLGCSLFYDAPSGVNTLTCVAVDVKGTFVRCTSDDPKMIAVTNAFTSSSYVHFRWNDREECTYLMVADSSNNEPKLP